MAQCFRAYCSFRGPCSIPSTHPGRSQPLAIPAPGHLVSLASSGTSLLILTFKTCINPLLLFLSHMGCSVPIRQMEGPKGHSLSTIKTGPRASMQRSIGDPGVGVSHKAGSVEARENCLTGRAASCICTSCMCWGHGQYSVS